MSSDSARCLVALALLALATCVAAAPSLAAWPTTPGGVPVSYAPPRTDGPPVAVPDSCGGVVCAWLDSLPGAATIDVQRIDHAGQPRWILNGLAVNPAESGTIAFDAAPDSSGGVYVAYTDHRIAGDTTDVYVQHVLASGVIDPAWQPAGEPVCAIPAIQGQPRIIADGHGGALVAWLDYRGNVDLAPDVYAQRVSPAGAAMWTPNGVPVVSQQGYQGPPMDLAPDGVGGLFIAWTDRRISPANPDVYAQHLDGVTGARTWPVPGLGVCTATGIQQDVRVTTSLGNLLLAWTDSRVGGAEHDIYAQGVTIAGSPMWAANGVRVNGPADTDEGTPVLVPDELGGAIIGWATGVSTPEDVHAQRLDATGAPRWGASGISVCSAAGLQIEQRAIPDQRGGAIFTWFDGRNASHVYAQRIDPTGANDWPVDGVLLASPSAAEDFPSIVPDGAGGAVVAWRNLAVAGTFNVYAQQIGAGGQLGVRAASKNCGPDICGHAYTDFGDAPEAIACYPSGTAGHFPTCISSSAAGTQEIACGPALSTPPGPTGYVEHVAGWTDSVYFGFGCNHPKIEGLAVTSELDGRIYPGLPSPLTAPSACSPSVTVTAFEHAFGETMWFGGDELLADLYDSGLLADPMLTSCTTKSFPYSAWLCGGGPTTVYLNVLVDWNQDGDWNDVVACVGPAGPTSCAPEWAVKNAAVTLTPGCNYLSTPPFASGPNTGPTWMRMTLTSSPVSDDFPWAGSAPPVGSGGAGVFHGGETEDYPLMVETGYTSVGDRTEVAFRLEAPWPNPAPGSTMLRFYLPRASRTELRIYDAAGRRVRTVLAGDLAVGAHTAVWDGRGDDGTRARAGLYFVRLRTDLGTRSQCIALTR